MPTSNLVLSTAPSLGYAGLTINIGGDKAHGPLSDVAKARARRSTSRSTAPR